MQELVNLVSRRFGKRADAFVIVPEGVFYDRPDAGFIEAAEPPREMAERDQGVAPHQGIGMSGESDADTGSRCGV